MNLTKLFNWNYFVQNLKKSKAIVSLLILLVPIFTSILLMTVEDNYILSFVELSGFNLFFMYIIPVVLSITLFNYVYKKNSVDFIGSMPISRKQIFSTNTIGGIGIIIGIQLLTFLTTIILGNIIPSLTIFTAMAWDILVFYTVSYIFVFIVSNLAMSLSGNKISQIILTAIILFLIPFIMVNANLNAGRQMKGIDPNYDEIELLEPYHFTAPSYFGDIILMNVEYNYDSISILKMLALSIIYYILGIILFNRKKLELAGESYENKIMHFIVKLITLLPMVAIFYSFNIEDKKSFGLFFLAIITVYYIVFDLITNKKIKWQVSLATLVGSVCLIFGFYSITNPILGSTSLKTIKIENIDNIELIGIDKRYYGIRKLGITIKEKDLIQKILSKESMYNIYDKNSYSENFYDEYNTIIKIKEKGKEYVKPLRISSKAYDDIEKIYGDKKIVFDLKNNIPVLSEDSLSKTEREKILKIINEKINNKFTFSEWIKFNDNTEYNLSLFNYRNHELNKLDFSFKNVKELYNEIILICNKHTKQILDICDIYSTGTTVTNFETKWEKFLKEEKNIDFENFEYKEFYQLCDLREKEIIEFLKKDCKKPFDIDKEYIIIEAHYPERIIYYTNQVNEFMEIMYSAYLEITTNEIEKESASNLIIEDNYMEEPEILEVTESI